MIKSILKEYKSFFIAYAVFVVLGLGFVLVASHGDEVMFFQSHHNTLADIFLYGLTEVFEFPYLLIFFLVIGIWSWRKLMVFLSAYGLASLVAQLLKRIYVIPRPAEVFETQRGIELYSYLKLRGEALPHSLSFPSGHTTVAFALLTILAFYMPKQMQILILCMAIAIGVSRIYLACHFLVDVLAGSFIGVSAAVCVYIIFKKQCNTAWTS